MLRMMGPSEYGLYSLVASTISYLTILDFGLGNAVIRYPSRSVQGAFHLLSLFLLDCSALYGFGVKFTSRFV